MKNPKYLVLLLAAVLTATACTKEIDTAEPSDECSILEIALEGQLGKATIRRTAADRGEVILYMLERSDNPRTEIRLEALALSVHATASVAEGDMLDFRNPERTARIVVRAQSGKQVLWTVSLKPYDPFYVGTWAVVDVKIYVDQNLSGNGTGQWETSMGGSEFGAAASAELDNRLIVEMDPEPIDGKFTGRIVNDAGADGAYGSFLGVYPGEYTAEEPMDMNPRLRHLIPAGESDWTLDLATDEMKITRNNITSTMTFRRDGSDLVFFDFALPDASGDLPGSNFYNNFWRSSYRFSYIVRKVE